jgi:uncharacterized membrane protein
MPVEPEAGRAGRLVHGGGADRPRAAVSAGPGEGAERPDGHLGRGAGARILVVGLRVDVEHGIQVRVERGEQGVRFQRAVVQALDGALVEQEGGPQPVFPHQALGPRGEADPVRGGQRLRVAARDRQRHVRLFPLFEGAQHPPDEGRVQERHIGSADEGGVGASVKRGEPSRDPLHRALAVAGVVHHHGAFRQLGEVLAAGPDNDDGPPGRAREDADRPAQQGGPVPLQRRLGHPHPRGPPAGQHHACASRHFAIVCAVPAAAGNRAGAEAATPYSGPVAEDDESDRSSGGSAISHLAGDNSLGRLLALSDGVFAIAMTLLALDLHVPTVPHVTGHATSQQLIHALAQNTDSYWSFLLSFYVIAIYWGGHRRLMRSVVVFNASLVRDTVFLLLIVAALPFPTSVLGKYGGTPFALALYGAFNALATIALILLTFDVRRADRVARNAETPADRVAAWEGWLNLVVFLLCIPAGYLFGSNGPYVLLLLVLTNRLPLLRRLAHRYLIGPRRFRIGPR